MRRAIAVVLMAVVAAACGSAPESPTPIGIGPIDCQGVPAQQCQEAVDQARGVSRAMLVQVLVRCSAPPCTDQAGQIQVQAQYADGSTTGWSSAWAGAVPAGPDQGAPAGQLPVRPVCLGVAEAMCLDMAMSAAGELPPDPAVRSISVRCTAVCTPTKGEGTTTVVLANGTTVLSNWGYESGG